jgi:hypothetical protein
VTIRCERVCQAMAVLALGTREGQREGARRGLLRYATLDAMPPVEKSGRIRENVAKGNPFGTVE